MATYAAYRTGTVTATNGSPTVTGSSTVWTDVNASAGSIIAIAGVNYEIASRGSGTQLTLTTNYAGSSGGGKAYVIDSVKDPTPLTAAEVATVQCLVTISTAAWAANGAGPISIASSGELKLINTSTSAGWKFTLTSNNAGISGSGKFTVQGNWISIGTGNGLSGQTAPHWDSGGDFIPCVWVETAAGSGVYERYYNLSPGVSGAARTIGVMSAFGAGKYGHVFTQSGNTITFGTGTNGKTPPAGANIRVPNIIVTHLGAAVGAASGSISASFVAMDTVQIPRIVLSASNALSYDVRRVSYGRAMDSVTNVMRLYCEDAGYSPLNAETDNILTFSIASGLSRDVTLKNCGGWSAAPTAPITAAGTVMSAIDCDYCAINNTTTDTQEILSITDGLSAVTIQGGVWVGRFGIVAGTISVDGSEHAEDPRLVEQATSTVKALFYFTGTSRNCSFKNFTVPAGGGFPGALFRLNTNTTYVADVLVSNVTINSSKFRTFIETATTAYAADWTVVGVYMAGSSNVAPLAPSRNLVNWTVKNFRSPDYSRFPSTLATRSVLAGYPASQTTFPTTNPAQPDTLQALVLTGAATAALHLIVAPTTSAFSSFLELSSRAYMDPTDGLVTVPLNEYVTVETPWVVLGATSITGYTPRGSAYVVAANATYCTLQYQIDKGSGWGSWTAVASLTGEAIDKNIGFRLRFRVTATASAIGTNVQVYGLTVTLAYDQSVLFPLNLVNVTLRNLVAGSRYLVERVSDGADLASGTAAGDTLVVPDIAYTADFQIRVRVRKSSGTPKYAPFETLATVTSAGADVWVSQASDTIAAP